MIKYKVFISSEDNKIHFTQEDLQKLLNEIYTEGYNDGQAAIKQSIGQITTPDIITLPYHPSPTIKPFDGTIQITCSGNDNFALNKQINSQGDNQ